MMNVQSGATGDADGRNKKGVNGEKKHPPSPEIWRGGKPRREEAGWLKCVCRRRSRRRGREGEYMGREVMY